MVDLELRINVRRRWLESIFELGHLEFQKRLWTGGAPGLVGDYDECVCKYFDDLGLDDNYKDFLRRGFISDSEYDLIESFHKGLTDYVDNPDKKALTSREVLDDPDWIKLTERAKDVWTKLRHSVSENHDLDYVRELESQLN